MDKSVLRSITYGLYIISSQNNDELGGCVVNAITQITSENPIVSISINKNNYTNKLIKESKKVAVSILSNSIQKDVISKFGFYSSEDTKKFENVSYNMIDNLPILNEGVCGYLIGEVINIIDVETHDIFLVRITNSKKINDEIPLTYEYYQKNMKGHSPKNAPTYVEPEIEKSNGNKYQCIICGHIYDDDKEKVKFEDLPDDWVCPMCGVGKDKFKKID